MRQSLKAGGGIVSQSLEKVPLSVQGRGLAALLPAYALPIQAQQSPAVIPIKTFSIFHWAAFYPQSIEVARYSRGVDLISHPRPEDNMNSRCSR
jgi:hypothetical protein